MNVAIPHNMSNMVEAVLWTMQMDNDPKHTFKADQDFLKAKKLNIGQRPTQPPDHNTMEQ